MPSPPARQVPWLRLLLSVAIAGGLLLGGVRYLSGDELARAFTTFAWAYAPWIALLGIGYTFLKGLRFVWLLQPVTNLPTGMSMRMYWAGEAATLLPGGVAARAGLLAEVKVPLSRSTAPILLNSVLDQVFFLLGTLIAALWFQQAREPALWLLAGVLVLAGVFAVPQLRRAFATGLARLAHRMHASERLEEFLLSLRSVTAARVLLLSLALTAVSFVVKLVLLDLCLRGLGWALSYAQLFLAFVLPTMLGRLSPIPAGVGVTEAGMVGFLVAGSNVSAEEALAATALFRISSVFLPALLGALVYFFSWRGERELHRLRGEG